MADGEPRGRRYWGASDQGFCLTPGHRDCHLKPHVPSRHLEAMTKVSIKYAIGGVLAGLRATAWQVIEGSQKLSQEGNNFYLDKSVFQRLESPGCVIKSRINAAIVGGDLFSILCQGETNIRPSWLLSRGNGRRSSGPDEAQSCFVRCQGAYSIGRHMDPSKGDIDRADTVFWTRVRHDSPERGKRSGLTIELQRKRGRSRRSSFRTQRPSSRRCCGS